MDICNSVSTQLCKSVQKVSQLVLMYCEHATYGDRRVQNIYLVTDDHQTRPWNNTWLSLNNDNGKNKMPVKLT